MSYYASKWMEWIDRLVVVIAIVGLVVGIVATRNADAERAPLVGGLVLDGAQTVWWSPEMVTERAPGKARTVYVQTFINTVDGPREVLIPALAVVAPKAVE